MPDDGKSLLLDIRILSVMFSIEGCQCFGKPYKPDGECPVLQHFPDTVIAVQLLRIEPHALPHKEWKIIHFLFSLDLKPVKQLLRYKIKNCIELIIKHSFISMTLYGKPRQVDGRERQVAP